MANVAKVKRQPVFIELDKTRQLKYTLNSFSEMEDRYGSVDDALQAMEKGSIKAVRFMLWAGLIHEETNQDGTYNLTESQVGALIELQDLEDLSEKMNEVMHLDMPEKDQPVAIPNAITPVTNA